MAPPTPRAPRWRRALPTLLAGALLLPLLWTAGAWAVGELTQKPGSAGCVSETGVGCQDGTALDGVFAAAVSSDGEQVYVAAATSDSLTTLDRDTTSGALTPRAGSSGCVSNSGTGGACQDGAALDGAADVAVSPDGRNVYATALNSDSVTVFDRDPATGTVVQKAGAAGCIMDAPVAGCQLGRGLIQILELVVSPDGANVYATSLRGGVAIFDRDPASGALTQKLGAAGCISHDGAAGPGGVGECILGTALAGASGIAISDDGANVYVAANQADAVAILDRDPVTGVLSQDPPGTGSCVSEDGSGGSCSDGDALDGPVGVATSGDGKHVYLTANTSDSVVSFARNQANGALTQLAGAAGCVSEDGTGDLCRDGIALDQATGIATSPDGLDVYVTANGSNAIAAFDRDGATGALSQKAGTAGCVSDSGTGGACQDGTALQGVRGIALSGDGASLYAAAIDSDAVAVVDRAGAPAPPPPLPPTVPTPPAAPAPPAPPAPPAIDTAGPSVTSFAFAPRRFAVMRGKGADRTRGRRKAAPRGSLVRFSLSEAASVRIAIERARPGRRAGTRCKRPTRKLRKRRACVRFTAAGTIARQSLPAGRSTIAFAGRIGKRALAAGRYRATIVATDAAGNRSAPRRASFAIVRRG